MPTDGLCCALLDLSLPPGKDAIMLGVPQLVVRWLAGDRIEDLAERVAGRSRLAVWQRVVHRLSSLGPTEARGYVRARAAAVIEYETIQLIEQEGAAVARLRRPIEHAALELLINTIMVQVSQNHRQAGRRLAA
jgi:hypothetical protein